MFILCNSVAKISKKKDIMSQKVVIGIDTVRYNLIEALTQNNVAPNIKRLIKHGTLKRMSSFVPEVSSVDCSSIIDVEPEQYGVYGFIVK